MMNESIASPIPAAYNELLNATEAAGFTMASHKLTCSLLRTLAVSKPRGRFLELGTGTGLSTSWILDGMDTDSTLISVDNEAAFINIAKQHLGYDKRVQLVETDGGAWISSNRLLKFDYIFADTWHGKYLMLEEVLQMLNPGALYIIDDMLPQPNWPEGHAKKASHLVEELENRQDLVVTKMGWASGIIIAVKK